MISKTPFLRSIFLVGLLFCSAFSQSQILVVGDSIGAGYGIEESRNWVSLLQGEMGNRKVINASISGDTSSGAKARLPALLSHYQPELVLLEVGGNDGLRGQPTALLEKNLKAMVDMARNAGAEVILLGMHIPPNYGKAYTEAFHQVYHTVARDKKVPLLPFLLEGIALDPAMMQSDRIHPNERAQPKILANVLPIVQAALD